LNAASDFGQALRGHAQHYAALIDREGPLLHGSGQPDSGAGQLQVMRLLQLELENIDAALDAATQYPLDPWLAQIAAFLYRFRIIRGDAAAVDGRYRELLSRAARGEPEADATLLVLRSGLAAALVRLGRFDAARELAQEIGAAADSSGDRRSQALSLRNLGLIEQGMGHFEAARELHERSLKLSIEVGDRYGECASLSNWGLAEYGLSNFDAARELLARALGAWRRRGDVFGEASTLQNLGNVEALVGNHAEADRLFRHALDLSRRLGSRSGETTALLALGYVQRRLGLQQEARENLRHALALARELGDRQLQVAALGNLATLEYELGGSAEAAGLFGQALALARDAGNPTLVAYLCIPTAGTLARCNKNTSSAAVLAGAILQLQQLGHHLDDDEQQLLDSVQRDVLLAATVGGLSPEQLEAERERGIMWDAEELVQAAIDALGAITDSQP
jgi:tetratricopeptide (TPR) repeat protein